MKKKQLFDVKMKVRAIRNGMDRRILEENNISSRISSAINSVEIIENRVSKLYEIINYSMDLYEVNEKKLNRKVEELGRYMHHKESHTSSQAAAKNDWNKLAFDGLMGIGAAAFHSKKLLRFGSGMNFKMYSKDGKVFFKLNNGPKDYVTNRKLLKQKFGGADKDWRKGFVTRMTNEGIPLYNEKQKGGFVQNRWRFSNTPFKELNQYVKNLSESAGVAARKISNATFADNLRVWDDFKGWKSASAISTAGKSLGLIGTGGMLWGNISDYRNDQTPDRLKNFAVNTSVDLVTGAGSVAAGAAIGSLFLPPLGTVIGAGAGAAINFSINVKVGDPPASLVDKTKNFIKNPVKESGKLIDKSSEFIGNVGKGLNKLCW